MRFILHVGLPKAASTSVQAWLHTHRQELLEKGVYVPKSGRRADRHSPGGRTQGHDILARMMHWPWALRLWLDRFARSAETANAHTVFLSAENLSHPANIADLPRFASALQRQLNRRPGWSLEILLITRDPESWMASYYNEAVLNGRSFESRTFDHFARDMTSDSISSETLAQTVTTCFEGTIHRLDIDRATGSNLFAWVNNILGTDVSQARVKRQRVSPTHEEIEERRKKNARLRAKPWRAAATPRTFLRVLLAKLPQKGYLSARRAVRGLFSIVAFAMLLQRE